MRRRLLLLTVFLLLSALSACGPATGAEPQAAQPTPAFTNATLAPTASPERVEHPTATAPADTTAPSEATSSPESAAPAPGTEEAPVAVARRALAEGWGVAESGIELLSVEPVEWRDAGLGCPLPGVDYARVTTPGYVVMLQAEGKEYEFHTDTSDRALLCEDGRLQLPPIPVTPGEIQDGDPWMPVDPPPGEESSR